MSKESKQLEKVKEYYGKTLTSRNDLKTNVCCPTESVPTQHRKLLKKIDDEIIEKYYGCGSPIPPEIKGCKVLDLGCGTGRDVYLASQLVGEKGFVIGVDMTNEQLEVARRHIQPHTERFQFAMPNIEFKEGYIEDLKSIGIKDNSVDVVISNCVINLSPDKQSVFSEIFRVLKPGGELYFSDIFSDKRVPEKLKNDAVLYSECLAGAMYTEDFRRMLRSVGCLDYRFMSYQPVTMQSPKVIAKLGMINFYSMTIRAFKLDSLEDACEDYGQIAIYLGTMPDAPHQFTLDLEHNFITGKPTLVCGNTASILKETRYAKYFKILGDKTIHYGAMECSHSSGSSAHSDAGHSEEGGCCF